MQCRHFTIRLSPQHLVEDEERLNTFLRQVRVQSLQSSLVAPKGERWSVLVFFEGGAAATAPGTPAADEAPLAPATPELSPEEQRVYERLRAWRSERSRLEGLPPYVVAQNAALLQIARRHRSLDGAADLAPIRQFGAARAERYGAEILRVLGEGGEPEAFLGENAG